MEVSPESSSAWRIVTTILHLSAVSIISFCLARRPFFRLERKVRPQCRASFIASSHAHTISTISRRDARFFDTTSHRGIVSTVIRCFRTHWITNYHINTTCARLAAFLTLMMSLLFSISSAILVHGVGINPNDDILPTQNGGSNNTPPKSCYAVIYVCIFLYGSTKICVCFFLIERVYLVTSAGITPPRMSTKTYRIGAIALGCYFTLLVLSILGRIATLTASQAPEDETMVWTGASKTATPAMGVCNIGFHLYAAVPFGVYDICLTFTLTAMFVIPIARSRVGGKERRSWANKLVRNITARMNKPQEPAIPLTAPTPRNPAVISPPFPSGGPDPEPRFEEERAASIADFSFEAVHSDELHRLAKRSLLAASAGLTTSCANVFFMIAQRGVEVGTSCMRWCLVDVVVNALAIYVVIQGREPWWKRAEDMERPTESLPIGIWGTDRSRESGQGERFGSKIPSTRRSTRSRRTSAGVLGDSHILSSGRRRLSAIANMSRKEQTRSASATSSRISRTFPMQRDVGNSPLLSALESPEEAGHGRDEERYSVGSLGTIKRNSNTHESESWSSIPLVIPPVAPPPNNLSTDMTFPEDITPTHILPTEPCLARTRYSLQLSVPNHDPRRRWSAVEGTLPLYRNEPYL